MNRKHLKYALPLSLLGLFVSLIFFVFLGGTQGATNNKGSLESHSSRLVVRQEGPVENKPAPDFALTDVNGKIVRLSDYKGKVVALNFWATWCPPCRKEIPDFIALQQEYGSQGIQFLGIALDDEGMQKIKPFLEHTPISYPTLLPDKSIVQNYGDMNVIPVTYLIDRKGILRTHFVGLRKQDIVEEMIRPLLAER